jgi:hypothetical protein
VIGAAVESVDATAGEVDKAWTLSELDKSGTGPLGTLGFCNVKKPNGSIDKRVWLTLNGLKIRDWTFTVPRVVDGVNSWAVALTTKLRQVHAASEAESLLSNVIGCESQDRSIVN